MADGSVTINTELNDDGIKKGPDKIKNAFGKLGSIASTALKGVTVAIGSVATAFTGIVTASVKARGELEQQIGGIETLFGTQGAKSVEEYADLVGKSVDEVKKDYETLSKAQEMALNNANNAYKTAGLSAIEYMQTATSFAASLKQSTKDEVEAAKVADMAIIDMSDNANKMGTDMALIQNAYQGFAKQNYMMLDNLKLGYGGTKTEMERLLADAQKITGIKYDINNLSDVYNAIHVIQQELGITGTTAKEASETLQGSMASLKASWSNFLSGSGDLGQVVKMAANVVSNVVRIVNEAMPQIMESIMSALPQLLSLGAELVQQFITGIITYLPQLMESAGQILDSLIQGIMNTLPQLMQQFIMGLLTYLPQILEMGITLLAELIKGIAQMLPELSIQIIQCINMIITIIIENIPTLLDAAIQFFMAIVDAIPTILEALITNLDEILKTIIYSIIDALPQLIDGAIQLFMGIIEAIPVIIEVLIENLPMIITTIVEGLIDGIDAIIEGAIQLFLAILEALPVIIKELIKESPKIIKALIQGISTMGEELKNAVLRLGNIIIEKIKELPGKMLEAGINLVKGLWEGISGSITWIKNKIKGWIGNVTSFIKNLFGIHSPSTVFRDEIGQYLGLGLGEGFDESLKDVYKDMQKAVEHENAKLTSNLTSKHQIQVTNEDNRQARLESIDNNKEITVNTTTNLDSKVIARETNKVNTRQKLQYGIA